MNITRKTTKMILCVLLCLSLVLSLSMMAAFAEEGERAPQNDAGVYEISNADQLYWFAAQVNSGNTDIDAVLTADIVVNEDISDEPLAWDPIGSEDTPYSGTFDGMGYTVSGLYVDSASATCVGLFGCVGSDGTVQNVGVVDSYISAKDCVGGVAGRNFGTIKGCMNDSEIEGSGSFVGGIAGDNVNGTVSDCTNDGTVTGDSDVGGVVGKSSGTVQSCYNEGGVIGTGTKIGGVVGEANQYSESTESYVIDCHNSGSVDGGSIIGGVVGQSNYSVVDRCGNSGAVTGSSELTLAHSAGGVVGWNYAGCTIINCYNTGAVTANFEYIGGVVGSNSSSTVSISYNTGAVSSTNADSTALSLVGAVAGRNNSGTVSGCYYLSGCAVDGSNVAQNGIGNSALGSTTADTESTTVKTADEFTSGAVAYLLQSVQGIPVGATAPLQVWYQNIDIGEADASPVLDDTHGIVYYGYSCDETLDAGYSNYVRAAERPEHSFEGNLASDREAKAATCTAAAVYYVKCDNCETVSETLTVSSGDPAGHSYGDPNFDWSEDGTAATAEFTCAVCEEGTEGHTHTETAAVEQTGSTDGNCETKATTTYTAKVTFEGEEYTDEMTVTGELGDCADADGDGKCDTCGEDMEPTDPTEESTDPTEESTDPTEESTDPTEEPTEPGYTECEKDEDCVIEPYADTLNSAWYHDGVHYCIENGYMNGTSETTFEPDADTSRGMLVTILYRLEGSPDISALTEPFDDVTEDQWFYAPVVWAYNEGVVNGTSDTTFEPDASITREQLATILYRYDGGEAKGTELTGFADADKVNDYAVAPMIWAVENGLVNGIEEGSEKLLAPRPMSDTDPNGNATRAQIATILMRYLEK